MPNLKRRHVCGAAILAATSFWRNVGSAAWGQYSDATLEELIRLYGAQSKTVAALERLGGRLKFDSNGPTKKLVGASFSRSKLNDADLASLKDLINRSPNVDFLDLSGTAISNAGLPRLCELAGIHRLNVAETGITEGGVSKLRRSLKKAYVSCRPLTMTYFPDQTTDLGNERFSSDWHSEDLYAMKEPSLLLLSRKDPKLVAYRFLYIPSFDRPFAVRIVAMGEGATVDSVQLDRSGYSGGRPILRNRLKLSGDQWSDWKDHVSEAGFWSLPTDLQTHSGADGAVFILEGVESGRYHVVEADTNDHPNPRQRRYKALCKAIAKLSGLYLLDSWKKY